MIAKKLQIKSLGLFLFLLLGVSCKENKKNQNQSILSIC
ncbi:hypothetical protein ADICYQ_3482 [Cyclobacterium qasimii M12-11B]|uniref:Lipoprotein n=1 Tax=Cyclobacterium qasimii M12-11B TaxID=641524 RepID=S7WTM8_9BACT|nr:hypothetical protein ADICYQ_3482 [Cyclobacterium qasimii M12-11B]